MGLEDSGQIPVPDPYLAMLDEWEKAQANAKAWAAKENDLRRQLFAGAFPNPKEGVNNHLLPDGRKIKGTHKIQRKIDEAAIAVTLQEMRNRGVANADDLVRYKPELSITAWKTLSDEMKLVFSPAVVSSPAMPTLEIIAAEVDV